MWSQWPTQHKPTWAAGNGVCVPLAVILSAHAVLLYGSSIGWWLLMLATNGLHGTTHLGSWKWCACSLGWSSIHTYSFFLWLQHWAEAAKFGHKWPAQHKPTREAGHRVVSFKIWLTFSPGKQSLCMVLALCSHQWPSWHKPTWAAVHGVCKVLFSRICHYSVNITWIILIYYEFHEIHKEP